jgi:hypothetical protein
MPLTGLTQSVNMYAKLTNGTTLRPATGNRIVFAGSTFNDAIIGFNDSTHVADGTGIHLCAGTHVNNLKFVTSTTASVNGSAPISLPVATGQSSLLIEVLNFQKVVVSNVKIFAFDTTDSTPVSNVTIYALEGGISTTWKDINAVANALSLTPVGGADTEHDFYVGLSMSPTAVGNRTGTLKFIATYV